MRRAAAGGHRTAGAWAQLRRARGLQGESTPLNRATSALSTYLAEVIFLLRRVVSSRHFPVEVTTFAVKACAQKYESCSEQKRVLALLGLLQSRQQSCAAQFH